MGNPKPQLKLSGAFASLGLCLLVGTLLAFGESRKVPLMPEAIPGANALAPTLASNVPTVAPAPPKSDVEEVAVILSNSRFYPAHVKVRASVAVRLVFTTVNRKSAALVIESLSNENRGTAEITREISSQQTTEVVMEPKAGTYRFHDPVSGATGELVAE